jgi:signal peptidase
MEKDTKHAIIVVAVAFIFIIAAFAGLSAASGVSPFQTVVESESMQHSNESQIGIIDTGDMVILKSKDKVTIQTFVDGYKNGYKKFGLYGDVIIYDRGGDQNPVIHRAILWLDYNPDGTWSAPSLSGYSADMWSCTSGTDFNHLSGTLTLKGLGYSGARNPTIDLSALSAAYPHSRYLTMGDNNNGFDQPNMVNGVNGLVQYQQIKSVAWFEVPWIGALTIVLGNNISAKESLKDYAPNAIPSLTATIITFLFIIAGMSFLFDYRYYYKERKKLYDDMNAPAPVFPVEEDDD